MSVSRRDARIRKLVALFAGDAWRSDNSLSERAPELKSITLPVAAVPVLVAVALGRSVPASDGPIDVGTRRELFVDRLLVEQTSGATLKLHAPIKASRPESPLPERHMMTVLKDGDRFCAYYRGSDPSYAGEFYTGHPGETVHFAESLDGHEWSFPNLTMHEIGGTRENNVILANQPPFLTNFMPFLDERPGVREEERYKALAGHPGPGDKRGLTEPGRGLFAFYSADGIRWTRQGEVIPYQPEWRHAFDSPNVSFWSEAERRYVCYFRTWTSPERLRSISRTTSPDFKTWSKPVDMKPNRPGEHLYTNGTHPYFRAPHIYVSLPTRFVPGRGDAPEYDRHDVNATDVLFMATRAGSETFERLFTEAFIRPGLDPERWRNRSNYVAQNVVPTGPTEMSIYHRSGDRYVLRTDGFVSVHAGSEEGELLTKPLLFSGSELSINVSTSAAGTLRVEVQRQDGKPVSGFALADCRPVFGDQIDRPVGWNDESDLSALAGRPVRLRFVLQECDLYSFRFHH